MHSTDLPTDTLEARLDALHEQLLALAGRVRVLEERGTIHPGWLAPPPAPPALPASTTTPITTTPITTTPITTPPFAAPMPSPLLEATPSSESNPGRVLALAGGVALLLGLIGFVAYAIEQALLPPLLRFVGAAILSALLTLAAWPLARRGHVAVAGAVGGAGLGAWFASWLFARHALALVGGTALALALVLGAAACLLIADRLRLRAMAVLASVAACATPLLVSLGSERLGELMAYQLALVAGLMVIDWRRRWPELPTLALAATWLLGGRWASMHLGPDNAWMFMLWSLVILLAGAASAWRLVVAELDAGERSHALARVLAGGVACWAAAAFAFWPLPHTLAQLSVGLAVWHLVLVALLSRRHAGHDHLAFVVLAWTQLVVAGPLALSGAATAWWWIALSVAAATLPWSPIIALRRGLLLGPALAAVAWSLTLPEPLAGPALFAAAVPFVRALLVRSESGQPSSDPLLASAALLAWTITLWVAGPTMLLVKLAGCLVPLVVLIVRACLVANRSTIDDALLACVAAAAEIAFVIEQLRALDLDGSPSDALALALACLALAALVAVLVRQATLAFMPERLADDLLDPLGVVIAAAVGAASCLFVAAIGSGGAAEQLGFTISIALAGLGLLIAGLRDERVRLRGVGLATIAGAGAKVVLLDLDGADPIWRALAFLAIGSVLIAGALAYSRAQQRRRTDG
jgi:uncharacterized membrane protein